ncbi:MAG: LytR/AlgR family response regulator transcription factor [Lautropia sp.]
MRALIVDDEAPARDRLRRLLGAFADVQVVGEARDGATALACVGELAPDVLFLDVQMPGASGLDVAASLPEPAPAVVFVTAYERYALRAFDAAAIDYLLKPIDPARLALAIERLRARGAERRDAGASSAARTRFAVQPSVAERVRPMHLLVPDRGRTHVVAVAEIAYLEAADNYVVVHTANHAPLLRRPLVRLLEDLGEGFVRCHRSAAVGVAHVARVEARGHGDGALVLRDGRQVPCSRPYRAAVLAALAAAAPDG